ncbi:pilus assembly protein [Pseudomonas fluvialis]|nr:PilC/PilY family type IV pilus protein [Pseudomonas pharmacofabricae]
MNSKAPTFPLKTITSALFASSFIFAVLDVQAAVSQSPLSLTVGVPPNLILTLDDSGSMREAFVPESIDNESATRRAKSAIYNAQYYDPAITYVIPKKYNTSGEEIGSYTTSFTTAYYNGYKPELGSIDLSTNYRVSWWYKTTAAHGSDFSATDPEYGYAQFAQNPVQDFPPTVSNIVESFTDRTGSCERSGYVNITCEYYLNSRNRTRFRGTESEIIEQTKAAVPAYYYLYDTTLVNCTSDKKDDNCYKKVDVTSDTDKQNFAIWYSFYRNRALAATTAANLAFTQLPSSVRFTWQGLNQCKTLNGTSTGCGGDNKFRQFDNAQRGRFLNWLHNINFYNGTPLRDALGRAGEFLKTETAWEKFPNATGNTTTNKYACRPSYHVLMTDGLWNNENGAPTDPLRPDHSAFKLPDNIDYDGTRRPYADSNTETLADLAMHYWATDLKKDLANKIKPFYVDNKGTESEKYWNARNNPATWQHMVNFTVGLGLTASLDKENLGWDNRQGTFNSPGYLNILSGTASWPKASSNSNNNVYDLWHTAINSRGEFFSADSPDTIVQAFTDIMSRIAERKSVAAKPAINSGQVVEDVTDGTKVTTVSYQTSYSSEDNWAGDLTRSDKERKFNAATGTYVDSFSQKWSAKDKMPAPVARNIRIKGSGTSGLQAFTWSNAGDAATVGTLANLLSRDPEKGNAADSLGEARLNYLRGERTGEGTTFRTRSSVLGDLYSSSPAVVSRARYLTSFANRLEGNTAYTTFAASMNNRKTMVYVGGNDGMLHGFNAATGVEEFAFIPSAVFDKLNKYTGKNYSHEFYVDGSPVVADVYDGTSWRTILVGTLRAGGKSVFALDITTPGSEKLLWEFDDSKLTGTDAVKMGYSFSKPTVARLATGNWAVVFGNGYEAASHTNGKAALFVLNAVTGAMLTANDKGLEVAGTAGVANGLSTPKLSDYNADGIAEFAYAGDLQGNLWRFDLNPSKFAVAYGDKPLFSTVSSDPSKKPQPITAAPSLVAHPSGIGHLVIFGTGKYFEDTDKDGDKSMAQTVYGIWDAKTKPTDTTSAISITRSNLVTQSILTEGTAVDSQNQSSAARTITDNEITWFSRDANGVSTINKYGWTLDLKVGSTLDGEMVIEDMAKLGSTVFFQSLVPNNDPCADGASNWTYAINPVTGGKTSHHAFDLRFTAADKTNDVISGRKQDGEGGITISQKPDGSFLLCTGKECLPVPTPPDSHGRQTWRSIEEQ